MSQVKVFGLRASTCTRRVLTTLEEIGLPFDFETIGFEKTKTPEYLANKQPFGKVPVLQDGDYQIYESRAIARYLASAYDKTGTLYPTDAKIRGVIEQWISVEQSYYNAAEDLAVQLIFAKMRGFPSDDAKVKDAEGRLEQALVVLDARLAKSKFLAGENFTVADIVYMPYTHLVLAALPQYADLYGKHKNFMRWWQEVSSRPSWKKVSSQSEF
jgi:glutathione S-transferase